MSRFLLIRHAANDYVGKGLSGRMAGIHLNAEGQGQAQQLARRLAGVSITGIYSSPLERAHQTADAIAAHRRLPVHLSDYLIEIDFGEWTGRSFSELAGDAQWRQFNSMRTCVRPPKGELISDVQQRITSFLDQLTWQQPQGTLALVSHADVIRAAICYYAGVSLDLMHRFEIGLASVSEIELGRDGVRILRLNDTGGRS